MTLHWRIGACFFFIRESKPWPFNKDKLLGLNNEISYEKLNSVTKRSRKSVAQYFCSASIFQKQNFQFFWLNYRFKAALLTSSSLLSQSYPSHEYICLSMLHQDDEFSCIKHCFYRPPFLMEIIRCIWITIEWLLYVTLVT